MSEDRSNPTLPTDYVNPGFLGNGFVLPAQDPGGTTPGERDAMVRGRGALPPGVTPYDPRTPDVEIGRPTQHVPTEGWTDPAHPRDVDPGFERGLPGRDLPQGHPGVHMTDPGMLQPQAPQQPIQRPENALPPIEGWINRANQSLTEPPPGVHPEVHQAALQAAQQAYLTALQNHADIMRARQAQAPPEDIPQGA